MKKATVEFYNNLFELARSDRAEPAAAAEIFGRLIAYDFGAAAEVWEYLLLSSARPDTYKALGENVFSVFCAANASRANKLIVENDAVRAVLYSASPTAADGHAGAAALYFLSANKIAESEEILRALIKNPDAGALCKHLTEKLFAALAEKNGGKPAMPKKLAELLLAATAKIKTPERAIIEQRIKEIL
jgi:hypothetical protein